MARRMAALRLMTQLARHEPSGGLLVAAEMICAERGIGAFVLSAGNLYDVDNLMAGIVVLSVIGLAISWLLGRIERRLLAWR
jgi:ABC-type nitrate/sulfonate/bicarbonate transport system permease component